MPNAKRPEEPDVDPQVRFCERGRSRGRPLLDPGAVRPGFARPQRNRESRAAATDQVIRHATFAVRNPAIAQKCRREVLVICLDPLQV